MSGLLLGIQGIRALEQALGGFAVFLLLFPETGKPAHGGGRFLLLLGRVGFDRGAQALFRGGDLPAFDQGLGELYQEDGVLRRAFAFREGFCFAEETGGLGPGVGIAAAGDGQLHREGGIGLVEEDGLFQKDAGFARLVGGEEFIGDGEELRGIAAANLEGFRGMRESLFGL